jgi:hypothetical protein
MNASLGVLPEGLWEFLRANDGAEGHVGQSFLALWPIDHIAERNALLEVDAFAPGLMVFANNTGEELYAVDRRTDRPVIVNVPLVGLGHVEPTPVAADLAGMLRWLGGSEFVPAAATSASRGKLIWSIQPIIFGGDPTSRDNKRFVDVVDALKMAAWWNHRLLESDVNRVTSRDAD